MSSFKYKFIKEGDGGPKPVPFQKVKVNYRGYLLDGTRFDSNFENTYQLGCPGGRDQERRMGAVARLCARQGES